MRKGELRPAGKQRGILGRITARRPFAQKLIILFLLAFILPVLAISLIFYRLSMDASYSKIVSAVQTTARQTKESLEDRLAQAVRVADNIETMMLSLPEGKDPMDPEVLDAYSRLRTNAYSLQASFDFSHICFFLKEDKLYSSEGLMFYPLSSLPRFHLSVEQLMSAPENSFWTYVPDQTYPFMVSLTYEAFSELSYVRFQKNRNQGSPGFAFFISIDLQDVSQQLRSSYAQESIAACLLSPDGQVMASSGEEPFLEGGAVPEEIWEAACLGELWSDSRAFYDVEQLDEGFLFVTRVEKSYIWADSFAYILVLGIMLLVAVPLVCLLIVYLTKGMTRRITLLSEALGQVDVEGNEFHAAEIAYVQQMPRSEYDEIDALADVYNRMMRRLTQNVEHITSLKATEEKLKYRLLQSQINPHFLYNILASIAACNRLGRLDLADQMIRDLTMFYRMTLRKSEEMISIRDEIQIARLYLELEAICRDGNLSYHFDLEEGIENFLICRFTLQPFLENSIHHGMEGRSQLHIEVTASYLEDQIGIWIRDDGCGFMEERLRELKSALASGEVDTSRHFGICNVNARIRSPLFGNGHIEVESQEGEGTSVGILFDQILPDGE